MLSNSAAQIAVQLNTHRHMITAAFTCCTLCSGSIFRLDNSSLSLLREKGFVVFV